jgi:hypothetical protein
MTAAINAVPTQVTASLDSAYILMGKQTALHTSVVQDASARGTWLIDSAKTLTPEVELARKLPADTTDLGNNRIQIDRTLIIQSFDSGLYMLPPLAYVVGTDTFRTEELALKVIPVPVDTMTTIHTYGDTISIKSHFWDFLPDWLTDNWGWILLIIAFIVLATLYFIYRKKDFKSVILPKPKPIPPYEYAIQQLNALREMQLCEHGREKEFYTRLTDILRIYLEQRFNINAMEMTSTQIRTAIAANETTRPNNKYVSQILEVADFVKFAKVRPLPSDNAQSFNSAMQFVEATKPILDNEHADSKEATKVNPVATEKK